MQLNSHEIFVPPRERKPNPITPRILEIKGSISIEECHVDGYQNETYANCGNTNKTAKDTCF